MVGGSRPPRFGGPRPKGQHFLRSPAVAAELVRGAEIDPSDTVLEIGAGWGRLTRPLAERAGRVIAVELDPRLAARLERSFEHEPKITIAGGDILRTELPVGAWRAFGNLPFGLTTPILRRLLDDPTIGPTRADLLVQFEAARKRASIERATLLSLTWQPWWALTLERHVSRLSFEPSPTVDAGLLLVRRRHQALLEASERPAYVTMLRRAFDRGAWPVRRSLRDIVPANAWRRLARERGFAADAPPPALDVWDWAAVFREARRRGMRARESGRPRS